MAQGFESSKIGKLPAPNEYIEATFGDFDHFASTVKAWDLSFLQLEPGALRAQLAELRFDRSALLACSLTRGMQQQGGLPPGCRTFGIPLKGCSPFRWLGQQVDDDVLMIFPRDGELASRSHADFRVITLSLPEAHVEMIADREALGWVLNSGAHIARPGPRLLSDLRSRALDLLHQAKMKPGTRRDPQFRSKLEYDLLAIVLQALATTRPSSPRTMAEERRRVFRSAREIIEDRVHDVPTIGELAELTSSSVRTLRYAFEEELEISPKRYLKARRLQQLRRKLRSANPGMTVGEIAGDLGFWHLGQLASDYREMFDELPSATLSTNAWYS